MSVLVRIEPAGTLSGDTVHRVCLRSGTVIGWIEQTTGDALLARTAEGDSLVIGDAAIAFLNPADAAAGLWMAYVSRCPSAHYIKQSAA